MEFNYKDLSGSIHLGLLNYTRELQEHSLDLESENLRLHKQLAKSGNQYYQRDSARWGEKWQQKCIEVGELKQQLIELEAEKDAEINRLRHEIDYLQEQLDIYQQAENPPKKQQARDERTGRFVSKVPDADKPYQAWLMDSQGYGTAQIAAKLGVSGDTVKRYIRSEKSMRTKDGDLRPGIYIAQ